MQVGCSNVGSKAVVSIGPVDQTFIGSIQAAFLVGCQNPTGCTPPRFGYSNPPPACGTDSTGCAGNIDAFSSTRGPTALPGSCCAPALTCAGCSRRDWLPAASIQRLATAAASAPAAAPPPQPPGRAAASGSRCTDTCQ